MAIHALTLTLLLTVAQPAIDEFTRLEMAWNDAHKAGDAAVLDRLWADSLEVDVPKMPPMSKGQALAFARTGRMRFERYETSDISVRMFGETAVVTGKLVRERTIDGKPATDNWRFTKVYIRQDGAWRVVSFHASDAP
jgi:ketosteroid isomerase-like protein